MQSFDPLLTGLQDNGYTLIYAEVYTLYIPIRSAVMYDGVRIFSAYKRDEIYIRFSCEENAPSRIESNLSRTTVSNP